MRKTTIPRRTLLGTFSGLALAAIAGCGGSSGSPVGPGGSPTRAVQERTSEICRKVFSGTMLFGAVDGFGFGGGGVAMPSGGSAPAESNYSTGGTPQLSAFLKNLTLGGPTRARQSRMTVIGPLPPYYWPPQDSFYYDYFLGLWVETHHTESSSTYTLYEDEAKTKPAGAIISEWPTDWSVFPQTWKSRYTFTAGFLKGSHGFSENTTNEDWSGSSSFENVYIDGWKDKGANTWSGRGDSTWFNRTESGDGTSWTESAGSWRSNGSGGTRLSTSDGFSATFVFNADGSGHGTVTGELPGLPATITWDTQGNVTIRYADGTIERFNRWGIYPYPTPGPIPLLGGDGALTSSVSPPQ